MIENKRRKLQESILLTDAPLYEHWFAPTKPGEFMLPANGHV